MRRRRILQLLEYRQLWAFAFGKMLTDPVWWFYLFWLPKFLDQNYGVKGTALIPYVTTVYLIADVGSVGGGWISGASDQARLDAQPGAEILPLYLRFHHADGDGHLLR